MGSSLCRNGGLILFFFFLKVTDHLKAISKDTGFRVVPIVGGMSSEKQVRLLKQRPEIVVGTPGRLWELMSGGDKHLAEVSSTFGPIRCLAVNHIYILVSIILNIYCFDPFFYSLFCSCIRCHFLCLTRLIVW